MKTCTTCRYYRDIRGDRVCARFPRVPQRVDDNTVYMFPMTAADDWCGEYRRQHWWKFW